MEVVQESAAEERVSEVGEEGKETQQVPPSLTRFSFENLKKPISFSWQQLHSLKWTFLCHLIFFVFRTIAFVEDTEF